MQPTSFSKKRGPQEYIILNRKKQKLDLDHVHNKMVLPYELVKEIFLNSDVKTIGAMMCTCKHWNQIGSHLSLFDFCKSIVRLNLHDWQAYPKINKLHIDFNRLPITKNLAIPLIRYQTSLMTKKFALSILTLTSNDIHDNAIDLSLKRILDLINIVDVKENIDFLVFSTSLKNQVRMYRILVGEGEK